MAYIDYYKILGVDTVSYTHLDVYKRQALGWLSRENKIEFDQCDEELYVYLCVNVYIG